MKVLLVNKFHHLKGGSEKYYFTLADALKKNGHEVVFFAMHDDKNEKCPQEKYFVSNTSFNGGIKSKIKMVTSISYSKEAYRKMKALIENEKPEVAIFNLVHRQITLSIIDALKEKNIPIIWTMHDLITICPNYTMLNSHGVICEKCINKEFKYCVKSRCVKGSKLMSYLAVMEANSIKKRRWYDDINFYIAPSQFYKNKLEQAKFTKTPILYMKNPLPYDTEYNLNDKHENYFLYFGRLSPEKGIKTLIDSMKSIDYKLLVLGTGPIEEELKEYICKNSINNVELLGFKKGQELMDYIKKANSIILPSEWYENGPYSAMEAMALGKPLIVSNLGGLPELVANEKNGFIYTYKEELIKVLEKMINTSDEEYTRLCSDALDKARSWFNADEYIKQLENIFHQIIKKGDC